MDATLGNIIQFSLTLSIHISTFSSSSFLPHILYSLVTKCDSITYVTQCFSTTAFPVKPTIDWKTEYSKDNNTHAIMNYFITHNPDGWKKVILSAIYSRYHLHPIRGYPQLYNDRLVYFKPIHMESRYIALIFVRTVLRKKLFSQYHAGPSGGHMGEYKTLYRLRGRFFIRKWEKT